ncbi:MAG: exosome complex protein Rrp42 [Candidatus Nanoarchaeia archaeon]|nr:exosome complex protein Rrp42 [Candidatus Nanoarchaeia archaeon]
MNMIKDHIVKLLEKDMREDGRKLTEYRKEITIEYGVSPKSAEGSARVRIGKTEVVAGVKLDAGTPFPDTPDQGVMMVNAELLPLSNPNFESGPPSIDSIELSRVVDRGIRECHMIDTHKLCIKEGEKVWMIFIDIYPINDDGNLFDAASLAALAALKDARMPKFNEETGKVDYSERTKEPLPLSYEPIEVTVLKIKDKLIVDPSVDEWNSLDARLTVATLKDGKICALQKGGGAALTSEDVDNMVELAIEKGKELRKLL